MRADHDNDVIGATTMMWYIIRSVMPTEVTRDIDEQLSALDLPRMATRDVAQGTHFSASQQISTKCVRRRWIHY